MRVMIACSHTKMKLQKENDFKALGGTWEQGLGGGCPFAVTYKASLRHLVTD